MEKRAEQFVTDLLLLTGQNRSLCLELEAYSQGNLKEASALAQERISTILADFKEAQSEVQAKNVQVRQYKKLVDSLTSQVQRIMYEHVPITFMSYIHVRRCLSWIVTTKS